jgi:hypothetical protein
MQIDLQRLKQQYSSLSDSALLAIDRSELVETAQQCYDAEIAERGLSRRRRPKPADPGAEEEEAQYDDNQQYADEEPDWLEEASEVYSRTALTETAASEDVVDARDALEAAGIPCYLERTEIAEEAPSPATHRWRVLVPGQLNQQATSILERDMFNADFEAGWKAHLQTLSDTELDAMKPETAFCGLFDRVERVTRAYEEELARRNLKSESA